MEVTIKKLKDSSGTSKLYAVSQEQLKPGDLGFNIDNEIVQVDQSTCIFHQNKVIGEINQNLPLKDGDTVTILWKCKKESNCRYPFCTNECEGNSGFYVMGYEERGY